ncbi:MAG: ferritin-like domain-containing protein, partial [Candidatus Thiodiazotropha sp. (ex Notomyrtea botanica)]|nr:ferritin-like domain-containing protein [Candidatus Thiodiazotropha sp. (ex Notomyrtea botanica)]
MLSCSVEEKLSLTDEIASAWKSGRLRLSGWTSADDLREAGHPEKPDLVHPRHLSRRRLGSEKGRLALIHAIAHIEFN